MLKQLLVLAASVVVISTHHVNNQPHPCAIVRLDSPSGQPIHGNITFTATDDDKVHVTGSIFGLAPGEYGFHVHEKGDITGGCLSTGAHFNPENQPHGHPNDVERHVGDLGNVIFDENHVANIDFYDGVISIVGPHGILGRAVVLHEKQDDYGRSDHPDSRKTGNAGGRVACGVIGILGINDCSIKDDRRSKEAKWRGMLPSSAPSSVAATLVPVFSAVMMLY